ncbi:hypothetical protein M1345_02775 [Patescibacteria group bacterium]|nr:hypothetical protein [Patescibacteria group bacterium]
MAKTEAVDILDIWDADVSGEDIKQFAGRIVVGPYDEHRFGWTGHSPGVFFDKVRRGVYRVATPVERTFRLNTINLDKGISNIIIFEGRTIIAGSREGISWSARALASMDTPLIEDDKAFDGLEEAMISQGQQEALVREGFRLRG